MAEPAASESILEHIVSRTRRLYSLPAVAARVLELTSGDPCDPSAIKACIENDPALTAKILRVANSSLFGLRTEVKNLYQAIGLLGIRSLKMLVLGFSLPSELTAGVPASVLQRYWRHTVYRAVAARSLTQRHWQLPGDDAFLAGLLGGIGMLALIQDLGEAYTEFLEHAHEQGGVLTELELPVLGFDHAVLSARMLSHWGLNESLVRAVGRPRSLAEINKLPHEEQVLASALHLGELAADFLVSGHRLDALLQAAAGLKDLSASEVRSLLADLEQEVAPLADLFHLPPPQSGSFDQLFAKAQASLAELAETALLGNDIDSQLNHLLAEANDLQQALSRALSTAARRDDATTLRYRRSHAARSLQGPVLGLPRKSIEQALATAASRAIGRCREKRCPLSLLLITIDSYRELVLRIGVTETQRLMAWLVQSCRALAESDENLLVAGEAKFIVLVENNDRNTTVAAARELIEAARRWSAENISAAQAMKISVGVATLALPPRNFPERELIEAAGRCLQAAQASGGDTVKSIEI